MARALSLGLAAPIAIEAPFATLHKADVVALGRSLGVPLELTLSCMQPQNGVHCGRCSKCRERRDGFREAGGGSDAYRRIRGDESLINVDHTRIEERSVVSASRTPLLRLRELAVVKHSLRFGASWLTRLAAQGNAPVAGPDPELPAAGAEASPRGAARHLAAGRPTRGRDRCESCRRRCARRAPRRSPDGR